MSFIIIGNASWNLLKSGFTMRDTFDLTLGEGHAPNMYWADKWLERLLSLLRF